MPRAANPGRRRSSNNAQNTERRQQARDAAQQRSDAAQRGAQTKKKNQKIQRIKNSRVPGRNVTQNPRVGSDYDPSMRRSDTVRGNGGKVKWGPEPAERSDSLAEVAKGMRGRGAKNPRFATVEVDDFAGGKVKQRALVGDGPKGQTMMVQLSERDWRRYKEDNRNDPSLKIKASKG